MGSHYLTALAIVLAIPVVTLALVSGLVRWARDVVRRSPVVGGLGVLLAATALANLYVARSCGDGVNRPIVAVTLADEPCRRVGLLSVALVVLALVGTAAAARLRDVRR